MDEETLAVKSYILDSRDPASWIDLADNYIELHNKNPKVFALPVVHKLLEPVIVGFSKDLSGFIEFVKSIREAVPVQHYKDIHVIYRRLVVRNAQITRRSRLYTTVGKIEHDLYKKFTQAQKVQIAAWLEAYWGKERIEALDEVRRSSNTERLSTDVRADVCEEFWAKVDDNLKHGIYPMPPEHVYERS
jgi:hypothetical protein